MKKILLILILILAAMPLEATVRNTSGCTATAIQSAIDDSVDGDTVFIDSGAACSSTWTGGNGIDVPTGLDITIQGGGIGVTIITISGGGWGAGAPGIDLVDTASRVTGIEFRFFDSSTSNDYAIRTYGEGWRVDNCKFLYVYPGGGVTRAKYAVYTNWPFAPPSLAEAKIGGLIDNNILIGARIVTHSSTNFASLNSIWADPLLLGVAAGGTNIVFIEDNDCFNTTEADCVDAEYGGRYTLRFNDFVNTTSEVHSIRPAAFAVRGARAWEMYGNTYDCGNATYPFSQCQAALWIRIATGMAFKNEFSGTYYNSNFPIQLDNQRSFLTNPSPTLPMQQCDGSVAGSLKYDGGNAAAYGWPCRDQIGRSDDASLYAGTCPSGGCTIALPAQASRPAYFFLNRLDGLYINPGSPTVGGSNVCGTAYKPTGSCQDIVSARDYFKYNSVSASVTTNVTSGVGSGLRANRPASTTNGEAYWSTDQGGDWCDDDAPSGKCNFEISNNDGCLDIVTSGAWVNCSYTPYPYPYIVIPDVVTLSTLTPSTGNQAATVPITMAGILLNGGGATLTITGTGVSYNTLVCGSSTSCTVNIVIAATATVGDHDISITTSDGTSNTLPFTVTGLTFTSIVPDSCNRNTTCTGVSLTGTDFAAGSGTVNISGTGVTLNTISVNSATNITANFVINGAATLSTRTVTVTTVNGTSDGLDFTILPAASPTLTSISPNSGNLGATVGYALVGTNFNTGNAVVSVSGSGVSVISTNVLSATSITGALTIASDAATTARTVTVTTDTGTSESVAFTIQSPYGAGRGPIISRGGK